MKRKGELIQSFAQTEEDRLFLSRFLDKAELCEIRNSMTYTKFMDLHQRTIAQNVLREFTAVNWFFHGGTENAERCVAVFLPDYLSKEDVIASKDDPIAAVRALRHREDELTHRDYLGALMGLGIERECIGDIFVHDLGADIIVLREMSEFLLMHFDRAGRRRIELSEISTDKLLLPQEDFMELRDTVASLRLDAVCAMVFGLSRTKAAEFVQKGVVFLNFQQCFRADKTVVVGDRITVRGKGKCEICELLGESRKGRQILSVKKYG